MKEKKGFVLYKDQKDVIDDLTDEEAGKLIKAIYEYETTGELPELDRMLQLVVKPFVSTLKRDKVKYNEKCQKNKENAEKRCKKESLTDINSTLAEKFKMFD